MTKDISTSTEEEERKEQVAVIDAEAAEAIKKQEIMNNLAQLELLGSAG